jgi:hypothetical protein
MSVIRSDDPIEIKKQYEKRLYEQIYCSIIIREKEDLAKAKDFLSINGLILYELVRKEVRLICYFDNRHMWDTQYTRSNLYAQPWFVSSTEI